MRRSRGKVARPIDARSLAEALSFPGIDPRTWFSFATVDSDPVEWDEDHGYLVPLTLQPSQVQCVAVCAQGTAGDSEGEHSPFVEGDTVVVGIAQGMERAGVVVLGRVSNARARPPRTVAGQDATRNDAAFRKRRAPHLEEYGDRWTIRQASSEALLNVDAAGTWTLRDGGRGALQLSSDVFSYTSGDASMVLQFDLAASRFSVQCGESVLALSSLASVADLPLGTTSALSVPGALQIASMGNLAGEHASSVEGTANLIFWVLVQYTSALVSALGSMGAALAAAVAPTAGNPIVSLGPAWAAGLAAVSAALVPQVPTSLTQAIGTAAMTPQNTAVAAAIFSAMLSQPPKAEPVVPPLGQTRPGIGSAGTLVG
jgi:hypothetical protein